MNHADKGRRPFRYLTAVTVISVLLIILNAVLGMRIPFSVYFLLGYVGTLLVFVTWHAVLTKGWRHSLLMFSLSFVIAFTAEALGVNFGLVFGHYYYTEILGPSLLGVPFLAALAWEPIVYAAFCISDLLSPLVGTMTKSTRRLSPVWLAILGALATTAWDLMIDPIAVSQGWWAWVGGGQYMPYVANGVPIQNFLGWLLVAFVINLAYRKIAENVTRPARSESLILYGPLMLYASLFLTALGVALTILNRPEAALIGALTMGPFIVIVLTNIPAFLLSIRNQTAPLTNL